MGIKSKIGSEQPADNTPEKNISGEEDPWFAGNSTSIGEDEKILIEVSEHPFASSLFKGVLAVAMVVFASVLSGVVLSSATAAICTGIFLVVSNSSFFFPSRYTFTEEKLVIDRIIYRKAYQWSRFRCWSENRNGISLSPGSNPEKFDRFRGIFLVMGRDNREKVGPILQEVTGGKEQSPISP